MPSPFPGMDPYLEDPGIWPDVQATFIISLREAIADRLPGDYVARINEQPRIIGIEELCDRPVVVDPLPPPPGPRTGSVKLEAMAEFRRLSIAIIHRTDNNSATVIEVLSLTDKAEYAVGYVMERRQSMRWPGNFVEVDLLIGGERRPLASPWPVGHYQALIARRRLRRQAEVMTWSVRQPLPAIPIPLCSPDPDLIVPLAEVFSTTYDRGRYARSIDYSKPPSAPLHPDDLRWATELVAARPKS